MAASHRNRSTAWQVRAADRAATATITVGGLSVIGAILGICVFLMWVVFPLFGGAHVASQGAAELPGSATEPILWALDEYGALGLAGEADGTLRAFVAATGQLVDEQQVLPPNVHITAVSRPLGHTHTALGLSDGRVILGSIGFHTAFVNDCPLGLDPATPDVQRHGSGVVERTPERQWRVTTLAVDLGEPLTLFEGASAIAALDYRPAVQGDQLSGEVLAALNGNSEISLGKVRRRQNLLTGAERVDVARVPIPYVPRPTVPAYLLTNDTGNQLVLAWRDGIARRYDCRDPNNAQVTEERPLVEPGEEITALTVLVGGRSLLVGSSSGRVDVWFTARVAQPTTLAHPDSQHLVRAHRFAAHTAPITALSASPRDRTFVSADATGALVVMHATTEQILARVTAPAPIVQCTPTPKADGLLALDDQGRLHRWSYDGGHPEATLTTLFGPVWYEGYPAPTTTWQSTSGSDDFEPKLSLTPLIFGTLKATVYSMFFAVPIAIFAALYTSQFLHPRTRNWLKPAIEMMASLPSVVLGFVGALVLAPIVETHLVGMLLLIPGLPLLFWIAGLVAQLAPPHWVARLSGGARLITAVGLTLLGLVLCVLSGPSLERLLFHGDIMAWLDGRTGPPTIGWAVLLTPLLLLPAFRWRRAWLHPHLAGRTGLSPGAAELLSTLITLVVAAATGWLLGRVIVGLGFDARGSLVDTYVQRNTLVVGFVMGFAVIPIIYTIAEDALAAVPEHLRAGSLACGASTWQTTVHVILPIAMSGIFSAIMIGLGRAVGETMIVVMAAGNTPIMDPNPFNGLRALSANIAVELPEAVKDGTLYRVLFLAGLVLFAFTFAINTVAEIVRLRFRKRAVQL